MNSNIPLAFKTLLTCGFYSIYSAKNQQSKTKTIHAKNNAIYTMLIHEFHVLDPLIEENVYDPRSFLAPFKQ